MNQNKIVEETHDGQDNDDESSTDEQQEVPEKDVIAPQPATNPKSDVHAWRKRQSIAFHRNPLRLRRRMSQGKWKMNELIEVTSHPNVFLFISHKSSVLCLYRNLILFR